MNRFFVSFFAVLSGLLPLIYDTALKGFALLCVAAILSLFLFKSSAATRHLVWMVAVVALLFIPLLSVALPQWRILPVWVGGTSLASRPMVPGVVTPDPGMAGEDSAAAPDTFPVAGETAVTDTGLLEYSEDVPLAGQPVPIVKSPPVVATPFKFEADVKPPPLPWIAFLWMAGFILLSLRLLIAQLLLRFSGREGFDRGDLRIRTMLASTSAELGIRRKVVLRFDSRGTLPSVWGVFRSRLILPAEAREWGDAQLRSVLLHELAHIKRRDPLVQWLSQIACALHWWNPLVWLAAWRLHVERERACDDLVLSRGVRPSSYAEHLLEVATKFSPARWTSACGLAMARKTSLESRLRAVLQRKLNRRKVSAAILAVALVSGAGVAVPVAMLRAAEDEGLWNPPMAAHTGAVTEDGHFSVYCVHDGTRSAFVIAYRGDMNSSSSSSSNSKARTWTNDVKLEFKSDGGSVKLRALRDHAATDKLTFGGIDYDLTLGRLFLVDPKGAVRQLDFEVPVVRDRAAAEKLAKRIAGMAPLRGTQVGGNVWAMGTVVEGGKPLPANLESAAWGEAAESGLRAAWLLEPRGKAVRLGSVMKSRVLFHNVGKETVVFQTESLASGRLLHEVFDSRREWRVPIGRFRRNGGPTEGGHSVLKTPANTARWRGTGSRSAPIDFEEEFSKGSIGAVIKAEEGDTLSLSSVGRCKDLFGDPENPERDSGGRSIEELVAALAPLPKDRAEEREEMRSANSWWSFLARNPSEEELRELGRRWIRLEALVKLKDRLQKRGGYPRLRCRKFADGKVHLPRDPEPDPKAAERIRTATQPGRFILGENVQASGDAGDVDVRREGDPQRPQQGESVHRIL